MSKLIDFMSRQITDMKNRLFDPETEVVDLSAENVITTSGLTGYAGSGLESEDEETETP